MQQHPLPQALLHQQPGSAGVFRLLLLICCFEQSQEKCGREGRGLVSLALGDGAQSVGRQSGSGDGQLKGQLQDLSDAAS